MIVSGLHVSKETFKRLEWKMQKMREHTLHVIFTCPLWISIVHEKNLMKKGHFDLNKMKNKQSKKQQQQQKTK